MRCVLWMFVLVAGLGCRGQTSKETPFVPIRNMYSQPRYNPQSQSLLFSDRRTMRPPVPFTVAQEMEVFDHVRTGVKNDLSGYVQTIPVEVIGRIHGLKNAVERGQERFNIYCSPCHDRTGSGAGMVVKRGLLPPPTFHQDRLRHAPDGQLFATITNGIRNMPPYAAQIPVDDRWAIVAYVRALQMGMAEKK